MFTDLDRAAQWFDDWREWVEWVEEHGPGEIGKLEREKTAAGRKPLSVCELFLHAEELSQRAEAWAYLCGALCDQGGLDEQQYKELSEDDRTQYAAVPDSPSWWGPARGRYIRRQALEYLRKRSERLGLAPLRWRAGLRCSSCSRHYPGTPREDGSSEWVGDISLGQGDDGWVIYRCSACGCEFIEDSSCQFTGDMGRTMSLAEATALDKKEQAVMGGTFLLGRPPKWYERLIGSLLSGRREES